MQIRANALKLGLVIMTVGLSNPQMSPQQINQACAYSSLPLPLPLPIGGDEPLLNPLLLLLLTPLALLLLLPSGLGLAPAMNPLSGFNMWALYAW